MVKVRPFFKTFNSRTIIFKVIDFRIIITHFTLRTVDLMSPYFLIPCDFEQSFPNRISIVLPMPLYGWRIFTRALLFLPSCHRHHHHELIIHLLSIISVSEEVKGCKIIFQKFSSPRLSLSYFCFVRITSEAKFTVLYKDQNNSNTILWVWT